MRYVAFALVTAVALHTLLYAVRVWSLPNRRGAVSLCLLSAGLVALGWWVLFR